MCKKIVLLAFVMMFLLSLTFGTRVVMPVAALTVPKVSPVLQSSLSVHNINTSISYSTIQEAINAPVTLDGHTIQVDSGTYYEHVVVNKTVMLIGEDPVTTIIHGNGTKTVVTIKARDVEVRGFTIQNGGQDFIDCGIFVANCTENISNNLIRNSAFGIKLLKSNSSSIIGNTIMNNSWAGIHISDSNENIFYDNTVADNSIGVWIASSAIPNTFYHNNFIDNVNQVSPSFPPLTRWDNGTEGNYWGYYMGIDMDGDGIGETLTPHLGIDDYPLIIPTRPFPVVWDDIIYTIALLSNSTVSSFYFSQPFTQIGFNVTGSLYTTGFCNVTIPSNLLGATPTDPWVIRIDSINTTYIWTENATHSTLYFTYNHTTHRVQIIGTEVIPEFPVAIVLPFFIIVTLAVMVLRKRRKERHNHGSFRTKSYFSRFPILC